MELSDPRIERIERALVKLGLVACDRCGEWVRPEFGAEQFTARLADGEVHLCKGCVPDALDGFDILTARDLEDLGFRRSVVRWALATLMDSDPVRVRVLARFPETYASIRSV